MDWPKIIAETVAPGVGGLIGSLGGAYFKSYLTEKGKNLATYEDVKTLLAEERGKGYEQEKGKRLATHEDIENVLKEVRSVTRETETIKAQIGRDLWTKQKVWEQKREAYAKVLTVNHNLVECLKDLHQALQSSTRSAGEQRRSADQKFQEAQNRYYLELVPAFVREMDVAEIFSGLEAAKVLQNFRDWQESVESGTDFDRRVEFMGAWRSHFIKAVRIDLGVPGHE